MNYNENYNDKKRNRKKGFVIVLSLVTALAVVAGSLLAYFSDVFTSSTELTAGTLNLEGGTKFYINDDTLLNAATAEDMACINPGDIIYVVCTVTNEGSKSAWTKGFISIESEDLTVAQMNGVFTVYEGKGITGSALVADVTSGTLVFADSSTSILNGTTEVDTSTTGEDDGRTRTLVYTIVFSSAAGNDFQAQAIDVNLVVKALQYRNNTVDTIANPLDWDLAEPYTPETP